MLRLRIILMQGDRVKALTFMLTNIKEENQGENYILNSYPFKVLLREHPSKQKENIEP